MAPVIGSEVLHGNSFFPSKSVVLGVVAWELVPEKHKKGWRVIEYWEKEEALAAKSWVLLKKTGGVERHVVPMEVFEACYFVSHEAMCAAYEKKPAALAA